MHTFADDPSNETVLAREFMNLKSRINRMKLYIPFALSLMMAAPAYSQSALDFAIMHFNMDVDSRGEFVMVPSSQPMMVDLSENTTLAEVLEHFNMSIDSEGELSGQNGVTVFMSDPTYAAEIFERLRAESRSDE